MQEGERDLNEKRHLNTKESMTSWRWEGSKGYVKNLG